MSNAPMVAVGINSRSKEPDDRHRQLLRARRERPRGYTAA